MENEKEYISLNWDNLIKDPDLWEVIKEELDYGLEGECLMKIVTAAKAKGYKDSQVFMPMQEEEIVSLFKDTTED